MAFSIPSGTFTTYYEVCDELINSVFVGNQCTIVYPPKSEACVSCPQPQGGGHNVFPHGGSMPFSMPECPACGGTGYKETEVTETVRLRVYWRRKDWIRVADSLHIDAAEAQIIGYLTDLPKIKKASHLLLVTTQNAEKIKMKLAGKAMPHGFGKNRYFVAYLEEA